MMLKSKLVLQCQQFIRSFPIARKDNKDKPGRDLHLVHENIDDTIKKRLVDFYSTTYLKDDLVVLASGVTDLKELKHFIETRLVNKSSILLVDHAGDRIVAAISGGPNTPTTDGDIRMCADSLMNDSASRRMLYLWAAMTSENKLLDRFPLPQAWDVSFVATEPSMRNLGLARFLLRQQQRLALNKGYKLLSVQCTSPAMAKVCEKARYELLLRRRLEKYHDQFGKPYIHNDYFIHIFYTLLTPRKRFFNHLPY